ncbi:MAG: hypothetical protein ACK4SY_00855 [Pyrobaculum sp.]
MKIAVLLMLAAIALAATNSTNPLQKIEQMIADVFSSLDRFLTHVRDIVKLHISSIAKTLSIILAMIGAVLYFSGISKYNGRGMLIGAALLYIFAELLGAV